jgi:hypothetical protein
MRTTGLEVEEDKEGKSCTTPLSKAIAEAGFSEEMLLAMTLAGT